MVWVPVAFKCCPIKGFLLDTALQQAVLVRLRIPTRYNISCYQSSYRKY